MEEYSDEELLNEFRSGDNPDHAFNLIVRKYQKRLYFHIRRIVIDHDDANDVVQNTFIKAWKGLNDFREEAKLYTWLYRIASNESMTFLKRKRAGMFLSLDNLQDVLQDKLSGSEYIEADESLLRLQKAILTLPDRQRLVFNLRYFDELKYEDIAEITGVTVGSLKASYHLAVKKIEKKIRGD